MAVFQKKSGGGAKGLNLPNTLEETRVVDKYLGIFVLKLQQKSDFYAKGVYLAYVPVLLPKVCRLDGTWRHFTPKSP